MKKEEEEGPPELVEHGSKANKGFKAKEDNTSDEDDGIAPDEVRECKILFHSENIPFLC